MLEWDGMFTLKIQSSVGKGATNRAEDVATVQQLLNLGAPPNGTRLLVDGAIGAKTFAAIETFQKSVVKLPKPDGRVDPAGRTLTVLNQTAGPVVSKLTSLPNASGTKGVTEADYERVAKLLGCEIAAIKAVDQVEAKGDGFFAGGRPKILFEAHQFSKHTGHKYDRAYPSISSATWNKALYAFGEAEYDRLRKAMTLDRPAALKSASWGRFQIMGFNHSSAGHPTVQAFVDAMFKSESAHLDAFVAFLKSTGLKEALKKKEWAKFAKGYNGPKFAANAYHTKLENAYNTFAKQSPKKK
jgi:hypothetical protein